MIDHIARRGLAEYCMVHLNGDMCSIFKIVTGGITISVKMPLVGNYQGRIFRIDQCYGTARKRNFQYIIHF